MSSQLDASERAQGHSRLAEARRALRLGRRDIAEAIVAEYRRSNSTDPEALIVLAEIGGSVGAFTKAESLLREALSLGPNNGPGRLALARILLNQARFTEAVVELDRYLAVEPGDSAALYMKASALEQLGDYQASIDILERLMEGPAQSKELWTSYGHRLRTMGRQEEATAAYRKALEMDSGYGAAWWGLAGLSGRFDRDDIVRMSDAVAGRSSGNQLSQLHFALGKAHEDFKDYGAAFHHFAKGNRIRHEMLKYDAGSITDKVQRSKTIYTRSFFDERDRQSRHSVEPIFILGMPRAGSTLVEQILGSHPLIEATSELPHIPAMVRQMEEAMWRPGATGYPELVQELTAGQLEALGTEYLERARAHRKTDRPYFVDKLPQNWLHVGFIRLILPGAKIVDVRRNPVACCFSNFKRHFSKAHPASFSLTDMGRYYVDYVEMMRHHDEVLPGFVHRLFHEKLVEEPEQQIRSLLGFLGVRFEPACLHSHSNDRPVRTPSAEQVRRPINSEGREAWMPYRSWLGPLEDALGSVGHCYPEIPEESGDQGSTG